MRAHHGHGRRRGRCGHGGPGGPGGPGGRCGRGGLPCTGRRFGLAGGGRRGRCPSGHRCSRRGGATRRALDQPYERADGGPGGTGRGGAAVVSGLRVPARSVPARGGPAREGRGRLRPGVPGRLDGRRGAGHGPLDGATARGSGGGLGCCRAPACRGGYDGVCGSGVPAAAGPYGGAPGLGCLGTRTRGGPGSVTVRRRPVRARLSDVPPPGRRHDGQPRGGGGRHRCGESLGRAGTHGQRPPAEQATRPLDHRRCGTGRLLLGLRSDAPDADRGGRGGGTRGGAGGVRGAWDGCGPRGGRHGPGTDVDGRGRRAQRHAGRCGRGHRGGCGRGRLPGRRAAPQRAPASGPRTAGVAQQGRVVRGAGGRRESGQGYAEPAPGTRLRTRSAGRGGGCPLHGRGARGVGPRGGGPGCGGRTWGRTLPFRCRAIRCCTARSRTAGSRTARSRTARSCTAGSCTARRSRRRSGGSRRLGRLPLDHGQDRVLRRGRAGGCVGRARGPAERDRVRRKLPQGFAQGGAHRRRGGRARGGLRPDGGQTLPGAGAPRLFRRLDRTGQALRCGSRGRCGSHGRCGSCGGRGRCARDQVARGRHRSAGDDQGWCGAPGTDRGGPRLRGRGEPGGRGGAGPPSDGRLRTGLGHRAGARTADRVGRAGLSAGGFPSGGAPGPRTARPLDGGEGPQRGRRTTGGAGHRRLYRLRLLRCSPGGAQEQRCSRGGGAGGARPCDTVDEADRCGRQDGVAELASVRDVLPRGEAGPEAQSVAHPDRGPGDGHGRWCDPPPAAVPVRLPAHRDDVLLRRLRPRGRGFLSGLHGDGRVVLPPVSSAEPVPELHALTRSR